MTLMFKCINILVCPRGNSWCMPPKYAITFLSISSLGCKMSFFASQENK